MFGVGFNNIKDDLNKCLETNYNSTFNKNHKYLTHNYYFYILISSGVLGLLAFIFYLITCYKVVLKQHRFEFYVLFINVLIVCFFEDFFYRAYGAFFFNLMLFTYYKNLFQEPKTSS